MVPVFAAVSAADNLALYAMTPTIRPETPSDEDAIEQVTRRAFLSHPYSHQTEQFIIRALRADHALSVSLVAEDAGRIVGHIAFSLVTIGDGVTGWYGLGPISVEPDLQRRGIGRALMERGLAELRKIGANGCVLVGDPAFYTRFGGLDHNSAQYHRVVMVLRHVRRCFLGPTVPLSVAGWADL